ncbi:MAG: outer membrane beta-barrel domain-containing protein [Proteobacteria bacterium]|nr:MAG: outer membrane beta-barrel domain-containing protein [Pseudomonadota bacterium]
MKALLPKCSKKIVRETGRSSLIALLAFAFLQSGVTRPVHAEDSSGPSAEAERFKTTEIRVIRPRYFNKAKRFELGAGLNSIMNESFIYTFMATGIATFHLNEEWAIEGTLSYGLNVDREDKRVLFDQFDIKTQIFRTQYQAELAVQYTPIYGKWQLPSGRLIYFDTYLTAGLGQTGISWEYDDFCEAPDMTKEGAEALPSNVVKGYPTFMFGAGQRYFVNRTTSYRFEIKAHRFLYNEIDAECSPVKAEASGQQFATGAAHDVITILLGISRFF